MYSFNKLAQVSAFKLKIDLQVNSDLSKENLYYFFI